MNGCEGHRFIRLLSATHILSPIRSLTPSACKVSSVARNYREAVASAQALEWQASMERGLTSMSKHVYELVSAPKGRKNIGSMWVFKVKPDGPLKFRFCAQGFSQVAEQTLEVHTIQSVASQLSSLCWSSLPATTGM